MSTRVQVVCDGTEPTGGHCPRTYLSDQRDGPAAATEATAYGWTRHHGRDLCPLCATHTAATDPWRCTTCGAPQDAHTARHPFTRWRPGPAFAPRQEHTP